jgi:hypothetical protein
VQGRRAVDDGEWRLHSILVGYASAAVFLANRTTHLPHATTPGQGRREISGYEFNLEKNNNNLGVSENFMMRSSQVTSGPTGKNLRDGKFRRPLQKQLRRPIQGALN